MMHSFSGRLPWFLILCFLQLGRSHAAVDTATCVAALGVTEGDCEALVALYESTNGDSWTSNTHWGTSNPSWFGVDVGNGRVIFIGLIGNGLTGTLPPELGNLDGLSQLILASNDLSGSIPPELGNLDSLSALDLSNNGLTGAIPPELGNVVTLSRVDLASNGLTGSIPAELGNISNLFQLALNGNNLSGPIPPGLGSLSGLSTLSLSDNSLTGLVPVEFIGLSSLEVLLLQNNQLQADSEGNAIIPAELQTWFDGLTLAIISGQSPPGFPSPGKAWRYKIWQDGAP
jgi:hypothetical protein